MLKPELLYVNCTKQEKPSKERMRIQREGRKMGKLLSHENRLQIMRAEGGGYDALHEWNNLLWKMIKETEVDFQES